MLLLLLTLVSSAAPDVATLVNQALIQRHDPGCTAIYALGDDALVRDTLIAATQTEPTPWAPMRAAGCVASQAAVDPIALNAARQWVQQSTAPGLALAVVHQLDALPAPIATALATFAAAQIPNDHRYAMLLRPRLATSIHADIRILVSQVE